MFLGRTDGWSATLTYGSAHFGKSLFWYAGEILFAYFLTEVVALGARQMGWVIASGLLLSALIDLALGNGLRLQLSDPRSAARLQLLGSVLCSVSLLAMFLGVYAPPEHRVIYTLATGLVFRGAYAIYDVPQNALMALATSDTAQRTRVASTRIWFSGAAVLVIAAAVGPLVASDGRHEGALRFLVLGAVISGLAIVSALLLNRTIARTDFASPLAVAIRQPSMQTQPVATISLLIALMIVTSLATPLFAKLEPYFVAYILRSPFWGGLIVISMALGIIAGQPVWAVADRRHSRASVVIFAAGLQIVGLIAFWRLADAPSWIPVFAAFLFGLGNGGVGMAMWAGFSDTVASTGRGREGLFYALFSGSGKVVLAIGSLGLGAFLGGIDFREKDTGMVLAAMTLLPALGAVVCMCLGAFWTRTAPRRS